ncbi:hypothetical protein C8J57DRAFT_1226882 [Mycena rebaudengoi]|nr:hypothetical protein C8J57DRAFT_1226882 [Mycena rebaudengoi]
MVEAASLIMFQHIFGILEPPTAATILHKLANEIPRFNMASCLELVVLLEQDRDEVRQLALRVLVALSSSEKCAKFVVTQTNAMSHVVSLVLCSSTTEAACHFLCNVARRDSLRAAIQNVKLASTLESFVLLWGQKYCERGDLLLVPC